MEGAVCLWWDREVSEDGYRIRDDVREAAHEIWQRASKKVAFVTGDAGDAAEMMEKTVLAVSQILDRRDAPQGSQRTAAFLMVAFSRELNRYAAKLRRVESSGSFYDLEALQVSSPGQDVDERIDHLRFINSLSETSKRIWCLRNIGYNWSQVARIVGISTTTVRSTFWRDLRRAQIEVEVAPPPIRVNRKARVDREKVWE